MSEEDEQDEQAHEDAEEPFADLLNEIERIGRDDRDAPSDGSDLDASGSGGEAVSEIFTEEPFEEIDSDELWSMLDEEDRIEASRGSEPDGLDGVETHVVSKRTFCETCPHLTAPPEFRCTHDGTEIMEFVDQDHVRVRDCPIVAERREELG